SVVQIRAGFLHEQARLAALEIPALWTLGGEHLPKARCNFASLAGTPPDPESAKARYGLSDEDMAQVRECVHRWVGRNKSLPDGHQLALVGEIAANAADSAGSWGRCESEHVFWARGWMENHSIRDHAKVLRLGFSGILREVDDKLQSAQLADPDFPRKENFWQAARSVCEAGMQLSRRYGAFAAKLAVEANNPADAERLQRMSEACLRVPEHGAKTLFEATQALWLSHILTCGEDGINANSIGRLDQLLQPYYEADLAAGRTTREEALELMEELACKFYLDYDVQAICLGGVDRSGNDAVNEMTEIILEATENVEFVRDVSVRLSGKSSPTFVHTCSRLIARGGGIPFLFNDDCFIPALTERGILLEDARDYAPIGCIELTIPGKANPHAVSAWMNSTKCLELALFGGQDHRGGKQLGPKTPTLTEMHSYEELYDCYCKQLQYFSDRMVYVCNRGELAQRERGPLPCWSTLTDDCIERGRDITDGGPVYNYHSICFLGTANTADSLAALRKLVFEEKKISAEDLLAALRADFDGWETLRRMLLTGAPKYGNDCDEVDGIAHDVAMHFIDLMDECRSPLNGRYFVHLFSFRCNIEFGHMVGATPDGRRAGEPLAYSLSAHQGRDEEGVTAMLRSLAKLPHAQAAGASAAIIDLDPKMVAGETGIQRLSQLIHSALRMGVGQLQWNVTSAERLRQAQEDPERFGNTTVRVAGYSQMFKLLSPELQEHVIARTKHTD
ncbi:MAG: hypothetical protein KAI66_20455, partial [Lentisphaeria bacterium]|nr:hypothetical protein [Lentisphaeria bacterium]